ncbi:MAG: SH3 domain-containing protein [Candidatus Omnitrophota bacterium]
MEKANIRAGQDESFETLGVFKKGDKVTVVEKSFSWYRVKLPENVKCYVNRKLVNFLRDGIGEINGNHVNIRARKDLNSSVIGQLNKLTKVQLLETLDDWYAISPVEGTYGWVYVDFVDFHSKETAPPRVVQLPTKNIYTLRRQEEARRQAEEERLRAEEEKIKVFLKGTVKLISQTSNENIRHQITTDDGQTFYLMGYRSVLDSFLDQCVQIEGLPQNEMSLDYPVLLIIKVLLVI